jgi:predicted RNA methylase
MQIAPKILDIIADAEVTGTQLRIVRQLDRPTYTAVNKVLEAAGGKWDRKAKAHVFPIPAADRIDQIVLTGEIEIPKDEFDYFPTPASLAAQLVEGLPYGIPMRILEPSAGQGALLTAIHTYNPLAQCVAYEISPTNLDVLVKVASSDWCIKHPTDFMEAQATYDFDAVVMNPPFSKRQDVKHALHAFQFLKQGGYFRAILSAGVTFRSDALTVKFRQMIDDCGGTITPLPTGAFKSSGTMVNTVMVKARRL